MRVHDLKCDPEPFEAVRLGIKTVEIRKDDRAYEPGDAVRLHETSPDRKVYTGRAAYRIITHVQKGYGVEDGFVALSIRSVEFVP